MEEEEDSTTPRARTVSLPQLQDDPAFSPLLRESSWPELAASPPTRDSRALPSVIRRVCLFFCLPPFLENSR